MAAYLAKCPKYAEKDTGRQESITIINFQKVLNINFLMTQHTIIISKRREERSISLQFNKEQVTAPNTSLLVNEGGRSHMFRVVFDSTYNINDDSRPPLWYDHSNLKELKTFVQKQKELLAKGEDAESLSKMDKEQETQRKKDAKKRKAEAAKANKRRLKQLRRLRQLKSNARKKKPIKKNRPRLWQKPKMRKKRKTTEQARQKMSRLKRLLKKHQKGGSNTCATAGS